MGLKYPHLFSPIKLGNVTFRNRIFASPISIPDISDMGYLRKDNIAFYGLRAKGGAASVSTGDGIIDFETGYMHPYKLKLDDPNIYPSLNDLTRTIRQYGAVPTVEFSHGGKFANVPNLIGDMKTSDHKTYGPDHEINNNGIEIFEMPREMIYGLVDKYAWCAQQAKKAGFGMILIHAGHGWLLNQFMSAASNHRTDEFGGSRENRMRFPLMVVDAVRNAVGPGFPIEFRMSGAQFTEGGYDIDEAVEMAKMLDGKVDLIHVSAGFHDNRDTFIITHPSMFHEHGCNVYLAARIKEAVNTPVATIGGLSDPEMMEEIIASGKADVVEMGRELMADPFFPRKARSGHEDEIVRCIRCFTCMHQLSYGRNMRCAVNPQIGRELDPPAIPVSGNCQKDVLVVGGGPAGMRAALSAANSGHHVILAEASDELGGQLKCEKHIPFKYDVWHYAETLRVLINKAGVDVRLNTEVTPEYAKAVAPDAIIVAIGGTLRKPDIPGIDSPNVLVASDFEKSECIVGDSVAILGGGLVGTETAAWFSEQGKVVTLVENGDDIARDATFPHKLALMHHLDNVDVKLRTRAIAVVPGGLQCKKNETGELFTVSADTIICAAGVTPRSKEAYALRECAPEFQIVGDCLESGQLFAAVSQGHYAGLNI